MPFAQGTALRLHLNYTLLPKYLKGLGYSTHMARAPRPPPCPSPPHPQGSF